ncbi:MAG: hypothetical protein QXR17_07220 [Candidatus Bathyarchaeia archaeon]
MKSVKTYVKDPFNAVLLYSFINIFLHYITIGRILPYMRSDIAFHIKLIYNEPLGKLLSTPYFAFYATLLPLKMLFDQETVYQIAGLLVFVNLLLIVAVYVFLKKLFSSTFSAVFGTLMLFSGNLACIPILSSLFIGRYILSSYDAYRQFEVLMFNSRYNITSYIVLQYVPFVLSLTTICFMMACLLTSNFDKARLLSTFFIICYVYLVHPLYVLLLHIFLMLSIFMATFFSDANFSLSYRDISRVTQFMIIAGFILLFNAYLGNATFTYKLQLLMFLMINIIMSLFLLFLGKKLGFILRIINSLSTFSLSLYRYLFFLAILLLWMFSLCKVLSMEDFNAWEIIDQPTPIWLYPMIIGVGPLIISGVLICIQNRSVHNVSWLYLLLPLIFVIAAPLSDFVNFYILGYKNLNGYLLYSGVTSGRMLAIANLLYNIGSGVVMGYSMEKTNNFQVSFLIGTSVLILLLALTLVLSLDYWRVIYKITLGTNNI